MDVCFPCTTSNWSETYPARIKSQNSKGSFHNFIDLDQICLALLDFTATLQHNETYIISRQIAKQGILLVRCSLVATRGDTGMQCNAVSNFDHAVLEL